MIPLHLAAFGTLDWCIVVGYMLGVLALGALVSKRGESEESYFLGGRNMPTWAVALSVLATSLSAATYVGAPEISYRGNLSYLILNIGGLLGALAVAVFFLPPLYAAGTTTIYGALEKRHGQGGVIAASVAFIFGRFLASGARLYIAAIAFSVILFNQVDTSSLVIAIVIFGAVGTAYTCMGGIRAVIWTDSLQIVLVIGAALVSIVYLLDAIPLSVGEIYDHLNSKDKLTVVDTGFGEDGYAWAASFTLLTAFAVIPQNMGSYGCDHDLVQRMLTTRSPWRASASLMAAQLAAIPVVFLFLVIGLLLSVFYDPTVMKDALPAEASSLSKSFKVYPQFLVKNMPAGLAGLTMTGMFAAAMSSLDSAVNALAASLVTDVIEPLQGKQAAKEGEGLTTPRWAVVGSGAVLIVFAVGCAVAHGNAEGNPSLINFALGVMTFALSGLLGVFCATLFTPRGNVYSLIAALLTGALTILVLQNLSWFVKDAAIAWPWWMLIASPLSFAVCCIGEPRMVEKVPPPAAAASGNEPADSSD